MTQSQIIRPECVKTLLSHFPLYDEVCKYGISHEGCLESQMNRVELIKERQRDKTDINSLIDRFFEDNPLGITFKALEELTLNYSGELFFIVLNCLQESIPFLRNYLRARSNHFSLVSDSPN